MTPLAPLIPTVIDFTKAIVASQNGRGKKGVSESESIYAPTAIHQLA